MAVSKPVQIKQASIVTPLKALSFASGVDERGEHNIPPDALNYGKNIRVNSSNNATRRPGKRRWLPDSVGFNGEVGTVYYDNALTHFIADDGKIKYCILGDTAWTDCGGDNEVTTTEGVMTTFLRVNDILLCLNGVDEMRYIDLATKNMVQFTYVADPTSTLTATPTGITGSGAFYV